MSEALFSQLLGTTTGLLLVPAVLQVWRQSLAASNPAGARRCPASVTSKPYDTFMRP